MHINDLSPYDYCLPFAFESVQCVGWLSPEHPYETGHAPPEFIKKMGDILRHRNQSFDIYVNIVRGVDPCDFCDNEIEIFDSILLGTCEIWIPGNHGWFASPSLIYHYISEHGYLPPRTFVEAVMQLNTETPFLGQEIYKQLMSEKMSEDSEGQ